MIDYFRVPRTVSNTDDALHCLQAAFIMTVETLSDIVVSDLEAEQITGFKSGVETWPYRMLSWLSGNNFDVIHVDAISAQGLSVDPRAELVRTGFDNDTIEYFFKISDFKAEAQAIDECLVRGVEFENRLPTLDDISVRIRDGWLPVVALDAGILTQEDRSGYQGHMVLVTGWHESRSLARIQDSGPPARWNWDVPSDLVAAAMRSPADSSGTITFVRRTTGSGARNGTQ
ncbi:hypothetical protein [Antrihabitans spumae]|uniref:Peptidase C39-like domain-containing protein n=1 Tax=Antrihabitans spumae TaxID=3373370 RepID=A0ABW7KGX8_9NOCA